MSDAPTYRCPECDTYSGSFTLEGDYIVHSICGREGTIASFDRDSDEYGRVYDHAEIDWEDEVHQESATGVLSSLSSDQAATVLALAQGLSAQAWVDLAPHLSCAEAEVVKAFLAAWRDDWSAQVFIDAHAAADDDESDLHYQGGS